LIGTLADGFREKKNTDEYTVIDGSFLIDRSQEQRFYKRLNGIERKYEKKLTFLAVGPLPLYDFAEIEIRRIDFKCLDEARREIGLDNEVSLSEINSAYGQLSRKNHPDLHHEDSLAVEKFRKIKNAYEVLTKYCEHYMCSLEKSKVETILLIEEKSGWSLQNRRFQWDEQ